MTHARLPIVLPFIIRNAISHIWKRKRGKIFWKYFDARSTIYVAQNSVLQHEYLTFYKKNDAKKKSLK